MPRLRRLIPTGKVFFVTTNLRRGLRHWTPGERTILCKVLHAVRARRDFRLAGFMIMPDHAHWLALPRPEDTLSTIMQQMPPERRKVLIAEGELRGDVGRLLQVVWAAAAEQAVPLPGSGEYHYDHQSCQ